MSNGKKVLLLIVWVICTLVFIAVMRESPTVIEQYGHWPTVAYIVCSYLFVFRKRYV